MHIIRIGRRTIETANLDKVLFPDAGLTKGALIDYYRRVAETMLPHLRDRPISMQRFPDGIGEGGFYQKKVADYFPDWIDTARVGTEDGEQEQVVVNRAATLVYLANQACICPHPWLSRRDRLDRPDRMIYDLDPSSGTFAETVAGARAVRDVLEEIGLTPFVQATGSRGLHVVVPLNRSADFDTVRQFARDVAELLVRRRPDDYTTEHRKNRRSGRLFLDYLRNAYGQTAVPPYAVRAVRGAPVATPLDWDELGRLDSARAYTVENLFRRLSRKGDPWAGIGRRAKGLTAPRRKLDELLERERE